MGMLFGGLGALTGGTGGLGSLLGIGFNVAGQLAQHQAASQAASAEAARQAQFVTQRNQALQLQQDSLRLKQSQTQEAGARDRFQERQKLQRAQASAKAAATAGGVGGLSVDSLLRDFATQTAQFTESSEQQEEFAALQTDLRLRSAGQQAQFDISSNTSPIERPSFAASALRIGQSVIGGLGGL